MSNQERAKQALDKVIDKARIHFYKPIQIAEILYRDRVKSDILLENLESYRKESKHWRDVVCIRLLGRTSTSSAKYQDDVFSPSAMPPELLRELGVMNRESGGGIEKYIYQRLVERLSSMNVALDYCRKHTPKTFKLEDLLLSFWYEPGLRRSIDKIYEIVVYALVSSVIEQIGVQIEVSVPASGRNLLAEFEDLTYKLVGLNLSVSECTTSALLHRVGVTNAADRGLDMWGNFGVAIQVKHLSLTEDLVDSIISEVRANKVVVVCKQAEAAVLTAIAYKLDSRLQSVITEEELVRWYVQAMQSKACLELGDIILQKLREEIEQEFPSLDGRINDFIKERGYSK